MTPQRQRLAIEEAEVRRLLGLWTSGLTPVLAYDHDGRLLGLTSWEHVEWGGFVPIVLEAWS